MTRSDVESAVSYLLTDKVDRALKSASIGLPERLKMAALEAFEQELPHDDEDVTRIRTSLRMLRNQGFFSFDPE